MPSQFEMKMSLASLGCRKGKFERRTSTQMHPEAKFWICWIFEPNGNDKFSIFFSPPLFPPTKFFLKMELQAEAFGPAGEDLNPSPMCYQCPTCHADEERSCTNSLRGRTKTRSLSASPALGSTKEFRYRFTARSSITQTRAPLNGDLELIT